jgi:hypothetical protein
VPAGFCRQVGFSPAHCCCWQWRHCAGACVSDHLYTCLTGTRTLRVVQARGEVVGPRLMHDTTASLCVRYCRADE